jgi:hypothetical protein
MCFMAATADSDPLRLEGETASFHRQLLFRENFCTRTTLVQGQLCSKTLLFRDSFVQGQLLFSDKLCSGAFLFRDSLCSKITFSLGRLLFTDSW